MVVVLGIEGWLGLGGRGRWVLWCRIRVGWVQIGRVLLEIRSQE